MCGCFLAGLEGGDRMKALSLVVFFKAVNCISFIFHGHRALALCCARTDRVSGVRVCFHFIPAPLIGRRSKCESKFVQPIVTGGEACMPLNTSSLK